MKKWILRTFFQRELGNLIAQWLQEAHEIEEGTEDLDLGELASISELSACAHQLARVMGIDLDWHK